MGRSERGVGRAIYGWFFSISIEGLSTYVEAEAFVLCPSNALLKSIHYFQF